MIYLVMLLLAFQTNCEAVSIVRSGVTAFAAGEPQIGPFTNVQDYLYGNAAHPFGGLAYIEARCGLRIAPGVLLATGEGD